MSNLRLVLIVLLITVVGVARWQGMFAPMSAELANVVHGWPLSTALTSDDKHKNNRAGTQKTNTPRLVKEVEKGTVQPVIEAKASQLTVHVVDHSLKSILNAIHKQTGIQIVDKAGLKHRLITADFDDLLLTSALRILLRDQDSFFLFSGGDRVEARLQSVWIYPRHTSRNIFPQINQATRLEYDLIDPEPETRIKAIDTVLQRQDDFAMEILIQALDDPDPEVRSEAVTRARNVDLSPPLDVLESMILYDPSQQVRRVALSHLTDNSTLDVADAKAIAEQAMNDPNPGIQSIAMEILQHIEAQLLSETESDW